MRYVKKQAQKEIEQYYEICKIRYDECIDNGYPDLAEEYWTRIETIEKIYQIVKKHGYTKD